MSVTVLIVSSAPKYTLDDLPTDGWEVRRTKQIVRAMVSAKNELGMTTEQLASRCNEWLGETDAVKPATLNGLFTGKRKSLSVTEVEMFAAVLLLPLLDLIYPPKQAVEARPRHEVASVDALVTALRPLVYFPGYRGPYGVPVGSRAEEVLSFVRAAWSVENSAVRAIGEVRTSGWDDAYAKTRIERFKVAITELNHQASKLEERFGEVPTLQEGSRWALAVNGGPAWDDEIDDELLNRIEPLFVGHEYKGYRLGRQ